MYEINGQTLLRLPESGRWLDRQSVGIDGSGRNTYEPRRSFEIRWGPLSYAEYGQLCSFFEAVEVSGTLSIVLPKPCADLWTGVAYDAKMDEPTFESYWETYHLGTRVRFRDIVT